MHQPIEKLSVHAWSATFTSIPSHNYRCICSLSLTFFSLCTSAALHFLFLFLLLFFSSSFSSFQFFPFLRMFFKSLALLLSFISSWQNFFCVLFSVAVIKNGLCIRSSLCMLGWQRLDAWKIGGGKITHILRQKANTKRQKEYNNGSF